MLPIIQFDPATMSLWYDVELISGADSSGTIADLIPSAIRGDAIEVSDRFSDIHDSKLRGRALQIVSAFWHEKRHFLDFVATNYGSFRFRQFLEVYTNLAPVIQIAKDRGRLCCPLEIYDDPVRAALMDISDFPSDLVAIAKMLARRRKMVEYDRQRENTRFGPMEIGGEAQLEALAFMAQSRFITLFFREQGARDFRDSLYNVENFSDKYFIIVEAAARLGLLPFKIRRAGQLQTEDIDEVITLEFRIAGSVFIRIASKRLRYRFKRE